MKIGMLSESLRLPFDQVLKKAIEIGIDGLQGYSAHGPLAPHNLNSRDISDINLKMNDAGLVFSALCGDLGGHGFQKKEDNKEKIDASYRIIELACELSSPVVTTHIGVIPEDANCEVYENMFEACSKISDFAEKAHVVFAVETGPEPAIRLKDFLDAVNSPGLGVNFDPANLVMVLDENPILGVDILSDYIAHTHAKDGIHLQPCDPVKLFDSFANNGIDGFEYGKYFLETPIGEGAVDWDEYLLALKQNGFNGFLTIEREVGENPILDIEQAVTFLKRKIKDLQLHNS